METDDLGPIRPGPITGLGGLPAPPFPLFVVLCKVAAVTVVGLEGTVVGAVVVRGCNCTLIFRDNMDGNGSIVTMICVFLTVFIIKSFL